MEMTMMMMMTIPLTKRTYINHAGANGSRCHQFDDCVLGVFLHLVL